MQANIQDKYKGKLKEMMLRLPKADAGDVFNEMFITTRIYKRDMGVDWSRKVDILEGTIMDIQRDAHMDEDTYLIRKSGEMLDYIGSEGRNIVRMMEESVCRAIERRIMEFEEGLSEEESPREVAEAELARILAKGRLKEREGRNRFLKEKLTPVSENGSYSVLDFIFDLNDKGIGYFEGQIDESFITADFKMRSSGNMFRMSMVFNEYDICAIIPNGKLGDEILGVLNRLFYQFPNIAYFSKSDPTRLVVLYMLGRNTEEADIKGIADDTTKHVVAINYEKGDITKWGNPSMDSRSEGE